MLQSDPNSRERLIQPTEMELGMAGLLTEEELLRELRVLYANRPLQFTKLVTRYYKGERARRVLDTLKTWPS